MDLLNALNVFTRIAETGSFSAVAREKNSSHSAITRLVGQLETHFGVRLFHRTTRRLSLTEDGQDLLAHARHLTDVATEMEETIGRHRREPSGLVRVGIPVAAARLLVNRLPMLLKRYPALQVELVVGDRFEDLITERLDVAYRVGQPADSSLVARSLGAFGRTAVAAGSYLEKHGTPSMPDDLLKHDCVVHNLGANSACWQFNGPDGVLKVEVVARFLANNSEVVRQAALAGYGIAMLSEPQVTDDLRAGRLHRVLPDFLSEPRPFFLVYPSRRHLPPRTRVVIDFLAEQIQTMISRLGDERVWGGHETSWLL